jgi:hypothetical protein
LSTKARTALSSDKYITSSNAIHVQDTTAVEIAPIVGTVPTIVQALEYRFAGEFAI